MPPPTQTPLPRIPGNEAGEAGVAEVPPQRPLLALSTFESMKWPISRLRLSIYLYQGLLSLTILALLLAIIHECRVHNVHVPGDITALTAAGVLMPFCVAMQLWLPYQTRRFTGLQRRVVGDLSLLKYIFLMIFIAIVGMLRNVGLPQNCNGWASDTDTSGIQPQPGFGKPGFSNGSPGSVGELDKYCGLAQAIFGMSVANGFSYLLLVLLAIYIRIRDFRLKVNATDAPDAPSRSSYYTTTVLVTNPTNNNSNTNTNDNPATSQALPTSLNSISEPQLPRKFSSSRRTNTETTASSSSTAPDKDTNSTIPLRDLDATRKYADHPFGVLSIGEESGKGKETGGGIREGGKAVEEAEKGKGKEAHV